MREYFDHAYEGFCNSFLPLIECAKVFFVYITLPLWIIPYAILKRRKAE